MKIVFLPRWFLVVFFLSFIPVIDVGAQTVPHYTIDAAIDLAGKKITAKQITQWTNNGSVEVHEIVFFVYPNRRYTKQEKDLLWRFAGYFKVNPFPSGFQTGRMNMFSVSSSGRKLSYAIEGADQTILRIKFDPGVKPGESVDIALDFSVDIPHIALGRFGWNDNIVRLSRWYPILSVYDSEKGWNQNPDYPFHRPFFSEASLYQVTLTIPQNQVIAHTGLQRGEYLISNGKKVSNFETLQPVREFSFAMSKDYKILIKTLEEVEILSYYLPGDEKVAEAAIASAEDLMKFYIQQFGKYPYDKFSIAPVDLGYGGEQMSSLIFIDRRAYRMPGMMNRYFDFLVAHETGHQWFYNLVGIDEYQEMWLEEGLNSYFIEKYLEQKYGEDGEVIDFPPWFKKYTGFLPKLTFKNTRDTRYKMIARTGMDHAIVSELSSFSEPSAIFSVTYGKGARVLGMLKHYVGQQVFAKVFERIFAEYRFKNLSINDFIRICEEESKQDLAWFFEPWLYGQEQLNYAVAGVRGKELTLRNIGGIKMPTEVKLTYQDGTVEHRLWKGEPVVDHISLTSSVPLTQVSIDPDNKLMDIDRVNNHWPRQWNMKFVPLYNGLYEVSALLPDDAYSLTVGPELVNNGFGVKASVQKPYDQILYAASDFEFGEQLHRSRAGYQLKNVLNTQTVLGVEISNTTDYDNGDDDLVSGKIFLRRELWPASYNVADLNDHLTVYLVRNQSINDGADFLSGREGIDNTDYGRRKEAIVGSALHLNRSGTAPDPRQGYLVDVFAENAGHFLGATQSFSRAAIDTSWYIPVTVQSQTAVRLKYGGGYPDDKVLFYAGGMDGLRGYDRKTVRGASMVLGSLEYRFPLWNHLRISFFDHILGLETISGVVFADVGQSWFSSLSSSALRKDAGVGLRLTLNIGSLFEKVIVRADVAQAINDDQEDHPRLWLGINHAF